MKNSELTFSFLKFYCKIEDKIMRMTRAYPSTARRNSYPFLACDTYFFLADIQLENEGDLHKLENGKSESVVYLNGNVTESVFHKIEEIMEARNERFTAIIIGDADIPPSNSILKKLSIHFSEIYCVNHPQDNKSNIKSIPLGLESQRYESAGRVQNFLKVPHFEKPKRGISLLVAWNDETFVQERRMARKVLRNSPLTFEIKSRVPAKLVHSYMRRSLMVACPRGNGLDTHRFWESLYLGALPVILKRNSISEYKKWPRVELESWDEFLAWDQQEILEVYERNTSGLMQFRNSAKKFLDDLGKTRG